MNYSLQTMALWCASAMENVINTNQWDTDLEYLYMQSEWKEYKSIRIE